MRTASACTPGCAVVRFHGVLAPNAGLRAAIVPGPVQNPIEHAEEHARTSARMGWARLLKRVFDIDLEHCPQCGGEFKIIAAIEEPAVIVRILTHLGLPARAPPRSPARALSFFQTARQSRRERFCRWADDPARPALSCAGQSASKSAPTGRCSDR
jgi:hypothetical protein